MSSGTSYQDLNQMAREAPDQFKESVSHKFAIGRSLSAKIMRSGVRPCDIAQIAQVPSDIKEQGHNQNKIEKELGKGLNRLEQIMVKRGKINELSERNMKKILKNDFYYNDLNEIRSINEFLYIKNNLAVNQNTKRIQSMREDLRKKQKQIQQIIQKEQNLVDQEDQVKANIDFAAYHKFLSGQKMQLNNQQSPKRNCTLNSSAVQNGRAHYDNNNSNQTLLQSYRNNSPFSDQIFISPVKQLNHLNTRNPQISQFEQYPQTNNKFNHQQTTESAKDDSTQYLDQDSQSSHTNINQMSPLTVSENIDSYKSTATQIHENNQIKLFNQDYYQNHLDNFLKNQKLSTISERDSEVIFQKDLDNYRSMMVLGSSQNTIKTNVVDINNMYELFQVKSPKSEQNNVSKSLLSPHSTIYQQKNLTMPARNRNSQNTNEESLNEGSQMTASNYIDQLNSKYPFSNKIVTRSQSAHVGQKQTEKHLSVPNHTNQQQNSTNQRRKSSQHSVYLHTQQQFYNPNLQNNLQYIASLPVYKCSFKKKSRQSLKNSENKSQNKQSQDSNYYSHYTMKEADKFLLNQQIVNNFKQKQNPQRQKESMILYNSMKTAKQFNDKIEEALQLNSKEYDQKYNQFSTQTNFTSRQTRTSCENRIKQTILKDNFNKTVSPRQQVDQIKNQQNNEQNISYQIKINNEEIIQQQNNQNQSQIKIENGIQNQKPETNLQFQQLSNQQSNYIRLSQIPFSQFEAEIGNSSQSENTPLNQQLQECSNINQNNQENNTFTSNEINHQYLTQQQVYTQNIDKLLCLQNNFVTETEELENTQASTATQRIQHQNINSKQNKNQISQKLSSSVRNSPIKVCTLKNNQVELFNTQQSIQETQQRILQNLKKIDSNQKKDRDYLAKMNMINQQINQSKSLDAIKRHRSQSQAQENGNSSNNYPKRAKLSRAQISKIFKTSEQIQMHKEVGLFNRITYNNFIQKNNKNKILLKNCNYVEYYQ